MRAILIGLGALVLYFLLWPVDVEPQSWGPPGPVSFDGALAQNTALTDTTTRLPLDNPGPEDIAIGPDGLLYTGLDDGGIVSLSPDTGEMVRRYPMEGRALGMEFDTEGLLWFADAYRGIVRLDTATGAQTLVVTMVPNRPGPHSLLGRQPVSPVTEPAQMPLAFADDLDIGPDGTVYFSDATLRFPARDAGGPFLGSLKEIWEHGESGVVYAYHLSTEEISLVLDGLTFSNGIAMGPDDGESILIVETGKHRILRQYLTGVRAGETEVWADNLPGYPDNINRDADGGYLVGLVSPRSPLADGLAQRPFLRKVLYRIPFFTDLAAPDAYGLLIRLDDDGHVIQSWHDPSGDIFAVTGAVRGPDGELYVSSLHDDEIVVLPGSE